MTNISLSPTDIRCSRWKKSRLRRTIPLLGSAFLITTAITGQAVAEPATDLADDARVGRFSGVVATNERGVLRVVDARGGAGAGGHITNGVQVAYPLASVTKVLTASTVMRLVEDGRIDLTATV